MAPGLRMTVFSKENVGGENGGADSCGTSWEMPGSVGLSASVSCPHPKHKKQASPRAIDPIHHFIKSPWAPAGVGHGGVRTFAANGKKLVALGATDTGARIKPFVAP